MTKWYLHLSSHIYKLRIKSLGNISHNIQYIKPIFLSIIMHIYFTYLSSATLQCLLRVVSGHIIDDSRDL